MATGNSRVKLANKKIMALGQFRDNLLGYLVAEMIALNAATFDLDTVLGTLIPVAAAGNNAIDVAASAGPYKAATGEGGLIVLEDGLAQFQGVVIPPDNGVVYDVALEQYAIDDDVEQNPRTGAVQYVKSTDTIGRFGAPDAVVDNGNGTLTFTVNSVMESGKDYSGRSVRVWLKALEDGGGVGPKSNDPAVAFETRVVGLVTTNNKITTAGQFGQAGTPSTDVDDYNIFLVGPTVMRHAAEDLRLTDGAVFIAGLTSSNPGNPVTSIDTTDQRVATFGLSSLSDVTRQDSHGYMKLSVQADASDSGEDQIRVKDSGGTTRYQVQEDGRVYIRGNKINMTDHGRFTDWQGAGSFNVGTFGVGGGQGIVPIASGTFAGKGRFAVAGSNVGGVVGTNNIMLTKLGLWQATLSASFRTDYPDITIRLKSWRTGATIATWYKRFPPNMAGTDRETVTVSTIFDADFSGQADNSYYIEFEYLAAYCAVYVYEGQFSLVSVDL